MRYPVPKDLEKFTLSRKLIISFLPPSFLVLYALGKFG
jgi:hypothetical protein